MNRVTKRTWLMSLFLIVLLAGAILVLLIIRKRIA